MIFSPSKLKYSSVVRYCLQNFFEFSQHLSWFVYNGKPIKKCVLSFNFSPSGAKIDARCALLIVAG